MGLTFDQLRAANVARLPLFKNAKGELAHPNPDGSDWTPLEWGGATGGELGELLNLLKKVRRGDLSMAEARPAITKELADVQCYLDHIANQCGVNLGLATVEKFNEVSLRVDAAVLFAQYGKHFMVLTGKDAEDAMKKLKNAAQLALLSEMSQEAQDNGEYDKPESGV